MRVPRPCRYWLQCSGLLWALAAAPQGPAAGSEPGRETAPSSAAFLGHASEARVRARLLGLPPGRSGLLVALEGRPEVKGWLRFEERLDVEGRSAERAIDEAFAGEDLQHGPTFASAPTVAESRGPAIFDANPESPSLNLLGVGLAGVRALVKRLRGPGEPSYFLYEAELADGSARLLLRQGRLPASALEQPGVSYHEVGAFSRLADARRAQAALEAAWATRLRRLPPAVALAP